ncbi:MAG: phosphotransferase [Acidiferrobacterales bacterium]|nr:phosphotransferase [Acidiferrobacterales bacterium]
MATNESLKHLCESDDRIKELIAWLSDVLEGDISSIQFASEDASFRRYFRIVHATRSYIAMDAPIEHMDIEVFVKIATKFLKSGINVPKIFEWSKEKGFALILDFGSTTYLDILTLSNADTLYTEAIDALIQLQLATSSEPDFLPPYDARLLNKEMDLFRDWYLPQHKNQEITDEISDVLEHTFGILTSKALEQPRVWVHLDYHSRNLMFTDDHNPGIIDFQDAVLGPISYDLMSLLRDCYIVWPNYKLKQWIHLYLKKAEQSGMSIDFEPDQFIEWFDWMGIQRHIKVAGIFSRLCYRDGKRKFLDDIPTVMNYLESVSGKYRELEPLHKLVLRLQMS